MKLLVVGLDAAAPEVLFGDERLRTFRRLMEAGCWGRLESVVPPITVPAWMCMATGRDPGSLGLYGFRNRSDHGYDDLEIADSGSVRELAVWDQVAREGGRSVLVGVPPSYPPRKINGVCVGCFLTPDTASVEYTHPPRVKEEIARWVGDYPVDVEGFRTEERDVLLDRIREMTRKHFTVVRQLLRTEPWDYFHFVEIGLDRVQHAFWRHHDPGHVLHQPDSPHRHVVRDYYRTLDREVGELLGLVEEDTTVLVVSDHGARSLDGGFCLNEWLVREGYLALKEEPEGPVRLEEAGVDWGRTRAWGAGGYYGRIFLNVRGREPEGTVDPAEYEALREELIAGLEAEVGGDGRRMENRVHRPEDLYREVRRIPPDLIAVFGDLAWRSVGSVGHGRLHVRENDTGPDDCNHARHGAFILAGRKVPAGGELRGAHLLDVAPTLLELGGYDVPRGMGRRSLLHGLGAVVGAPGSEGAPRGASLSGEAGDAVRRRLDGLGYIG